PVELGCALDQLLDGAGCTPEASHVPDHDAPVLGDADEGATGPVRVRVARRGLRGREVPSAHPCHAFGRLVDDAEPVAAEERPGCGADVPVAAEKPLTLDARQELEALAVRWVALGVVGE